MPDPHPMRGGKTYSGGMTATVVFSNGNTISYDKVVVQPSGVLRTYGMVLNDKSQDSAFAAHAWLQATGDVSYA